MFKFVIAWCQQSQELLSEYNKLGKNLYHQGMIPESELLIAKIDGDAERTLAKNYQIETFPVLYIQ